MPEFILKLTTTLILLTMSSASVEVALESASSKLEAERPTLNPSYSSLVKKKKVVSLKKNCKPAPFPHSLFTLSSTTALFKKMLSFSRSGVIKVVLKLYLVSIILIGLLDKIP